MFRILKMAAVVIGVSLVVVGAVVVYRETDLLTGSLVLLSGLVHGHAHGAEMAAGLHAGSYIAGMLIASAVLHGVGIGAMALGLRNRWALGSARVASACVAVCGALMLVGVL